MNPDVLESKKLEYLGRLGSAICRWDSASARKLALTLLVILRCEARTIHDRAESKLKEFRGLERAVKKAKEIGVTCILAKPCVEQLRSEWETARRELAGTGALVYHALDIWQGEGATFDDLCNLCNRNPERAREELYDFYHHNPDFVDEGWGDEWIEREPFSALATVHNLDYKNPRETGFIEDYVDAPLTHALKEYLFYTMLHTEEGRKAAHKALEAVFTGDMENAYTEVTDEDGTRHLYDKDGEEVGILGDEHDL